MPSAVQRLLDACREVFADGGAGIVPSLEDVDRIMSIFIRKTLLCWFQGISTNMIVVLDTLVVLPYVSCVLQSIRNSVMNGKLLRACTVRLFDAARVEAQLIDERHKSALHPQHLFGWWDQCFRRLREHNPPLLRSELADGIDASDVGLTPDVSYFHPGERR
ncbi:hypothetical protein BHE74_00045645 [Ensete ventricosum]|nr:hypothetical protein BHE74_00045645 [Ensete ventricosum]